MLNWDKGIEGLLFPCVFGLLFLCVLGFGFEGNKAE